MVLVIHWPEVAKVLRGEEKQKYFHLIPTPMLFTLPLTERRNVATPPFQTNFNYGGFLFVRQGPQQNGGLVGVLVDC